MGDRCFVEVDVLEEHGKKLTEVVLGEVVGEEPWTAYWENVGQDEGSKLVSVEIDGLNYAGYDEFKKAAEEHKLVFTGRHTAGDNYGEHVFAAADGEIAYAPAIEGLPVVGVGYSDGAGHPVSGWPVVPTVDETDIEKVMKYWKLHLRVQELARSVSPAEDLPDRLPTGASEGNSSS